MSPAVTRPCNVTVTVEPTGLDTTHMKIEDFASQREDHADMVSYSEDPGPHIGMYVLIYVFRSSHWSVRPHMAVGP